MGVVSNKKPVMGLTHTEGGHVRYVCLSVPYMLSCRVTLVWRAECILLYVDLSGALNRVVPLLQCCTPSQGSLRWQLPLP